MVVCVCEGSWDGKFGAATTKKMYPMSNLLLKRRLLSSGCFALVCSSPEIHARALRAHRPVGAPHTLATLKPGRQSRVIPVKLWPTLFRRLLYVGRERETTRGLALKMTQDNDPRHVNPESAAFFEANGIELVVSKRCKADGTFVAGFWTIRY